MKTIKLNLRAVQKQSKYFVYGGELNLSNQGQQELLSVLNAHGAAMRTKVLGFSMYPFIRSKDVLTIAPLNDRKLQVGEVIAFKNPISKKLTIHRVVARKGDRWIAKGDNSPESDGFIAFENILGRVIRLERRGQEVYLGFISGTCSYIIAFLSFHKLLTPAIKMVFIIRKLLLNIRHYLLLPFIKKK